MQVDPKKQERSAVLANCIFRQYGHAVPLSAVGASTSRSCRNDQPSRSGAVVDDSFNLRRAYRSVRRSKRITACLAQIKVPDTITGSFRARRRLPVVDLGHGSTAALAVFVIYLVLGILYEVSFIR